MFSLACVSIGKDPATQGIQGHLRAHGILLEELQVPSLPFFLKFHAPARITWSDQLRAGWPYW